MKTGTGWASILTSEINNDQALQPQRKLIFLLTICAGSFLLFLVQPMIARMALPRLGGAPSVWNSAMLVYQALLLLGYAYAHWLGRFTARQQGLVHILLFLIAAITLPIGLSNATPPADGNIYAWVPWLFFTSIGPLFFVVSAQAPLMQRWFSQSGAGDPYPLYAASNLGSFAGLIAYPTLVEPLLTVQQQSLMWSVGYAILTALVALCAITLVRSGQIVAPTESVKAPRDWRLIGKWILLAAVPSGLMLSTSLHLTTDIVAMPLLWVMPLGLYLLSFSVAFSDRRALATLLSRIAPVVLVFGGLLTFLALDDAPFAVAIATLITLFVVAVALHARLYELRPEPAELTGFYLAMSVGGMLGGLFCALIAPLVFDWTYEHPLLLVAAAALMAQAPLHKRLAEYLDGSTGERRRRWLMVAAFVSSLAAFGAFGDLPDHLERSIFIALLVVICLVIIGQRRHFAFAFLSLLLAVSIWSKLQLSTLDGVLTRSYFGIYTVGTETGYRRTLTHGTTLHGVQLLAPGKERNPVTYYAPRSGIGLTLSAAPSMFGPDARIGIVGLGAGTLACYAKPGQKWEFYEIDPAIVAIARNPKQFTYLSRCMPDLKVHIGDARLVLAGQSPAGADVLAIDAFSSDSVPMHLLTQEAFATYRRRLAPNGLLLVHISNRFLDLEPVVAAAAQAGWTARIRRYKVDDADRTESYASSSWVALSPSKTTIERLVRESGGEEWSTLNRRPGFTGWTDGYGSILPILKY